MREIHLIVHEHILDKISNGITDSPRLKEVLAEIARIKAKEEWLPHKDVATSISEELPPPSDDMLIIVSGCFTSDCVSVQKGMLELNGYKTRLNQKGCYDQE